MVKFTEKWHTGKSTLDYRNRLRSFITLAKVQNTVEITEKWHTGKNRGIYWNRVSFLNSGLTWKYFST